MTRPAATLTSSAARKGQTAHTRSWPGRQRGSIHCGGIAPPQRATELVGISAVAFSALYFLSDAIEVIQGGFSDGQLWLTFVAEAAVPIFVLGIARAHRPQFGRLARASAWAYASSYLVFTGTVLYALVNNTKDYATLSDDLGPIMITPGAVMVLAGLEFGYSVRRARLLPAWTAVALMAGVALVAAAQGLPDGAQLVAAGVRDLGFAGMGAALLANTRRRHLPTRADRGSPAVPNHGTRVLALK
jgi:hypothetical protein